jgi:membrane protein
MAKKKENPMNERPLIQRILTKLNTIEQGRLAPLLDVVTGFSNHRGVANSAYIAFYLILSLFPFLLALVAVISYLPWDISGFIHELSFFPPEIQRFLYSYVLNIKLNSGWLLLYSILMALWSSSRALTSIRFSLDQVFGNKSTHFVKTRIFAMLYNLVFILLLIVAFSLPALIDLVRVVIKNFFGNIEFIDGFLTWIRWIIMPMMLPMVIALVFMKVPSRKMALGKVWPGTLFTTSAWILLSNLFPILVSTSRNALYGALNTFIFMALFFQFLAQALIYGAEINRVVGKRKQNRHSKNAKKQNMLITE